MLRDAAEQKARKAFATMATHHDEAGVAGFGRGENAPIGHLRFASNRDFETKGFETLLLLVELGLRLIANLIGEFEIGLRNPERVGQVVPAIRHAQGVDKHKLRAAQLGDGRGMRDRVGGLL